METFDVVVIGAGPGGYPAAIRAAQLGAKAAIVEKEQLGGTCLNWGCIPTKALIAAAEIFEKIRHAEKYGISVKDAAPDYPVMIGNKNKAVQQLRSGVGSLLTANGVKQFTGTASFVDRNTIEAGGQRIGAKKIIIARIFAEARARGGKPRVPRHPKTAGHDDCPRRWIHRLRTGLHGGDARREGDPGRITRRHFAVARRRRAP
jgi:pyruvate/2-oxoglutarate dehydrogenase complex dihydrolipoamide dehydrogenase (E3) component